MAKKGWEKEPSRHALAAKGLKTRLDRTSRGLKITKLKLLESQVKSKYLEEWKTVKPFLKEGRSWIDAVLDADSANFDYTDKQSYKKLSASTRKAIDSLNSAIEETCVNYALIAMRNDNYAFLDEVEKLYSPAGEDAADIIDPYSGGSG